jgi:2-polyprenyl-6-methoxyphenol hydroxylase-like FAD-dependent oxidoreductase
MEGAKRKWRDLSIVGAGRARAALAYLLARHGLDAALVEPETDFARKA